PPAANLAIKEPGTIRHAEAGSQGRDPSVVRSHLDRSDRRNEHGACVVVIRGPIEFRFNSENSVADLPVVPELASPDEYAVVVSRVEVHTEERVGHVTSGPSAPDVAAEIKSSPTERRRCIDRGRRRIRSGPDANVSGIPGR